MFASVDDRHQLTVKSFGDAVKPYQPLRGPEGQISLWSSAWEPAITLVYNTTFSFIIESLLEETRDLQFYLPLWSEYVVNKFLLGHLVCVHKGMRTRILSLSWGSKKPEEGVVSFVPLYYSMRFDTDNDIGVDLILDWGTT